MTKNSATTPTDSHPIIWQRPVIMLGVVLVIGAALTYLAGSNLHRYETLRLKEKHAEATRAVVSAFDIEVSRTTEAVRDAGLMLESHPSITRDQFNRYMQKLVANQLSVSLIEWQPIVLADDLAEFEATARKEYASEYRVIQPDASGKGWEPVSGRETYVPVRLAWPANYRTEGFDMSFSPERMASKLESQRTRMPVASGTFPFMKKGMVDSGVRAVAISTTVFDARDIAQGYVAAVVDLPTLFERAARTADTVKVDFLVYPTDTQSGEPIYTWSGEGTETMRGKSDGDIGSRTDLLASVIFGQQTWRLELRPRAAFYDALPPNYSPLVYAGGFVMTLLLGLLLGGLWKFNQVRHRELSLRGKLIDSIPGAFYLFDDQGRFLMWNHNLESELGLTPQEIAGSHPLDFFDPKDKPVVENAIRQVFETGQASVEAPFSVRGGRRTPYLFNGLRLEVNSRPAVIGIGIDVSERKRAEEALHQSEQLYRNLVETTAAVAWEVDVATQRFTYISPQIENISGYGADQWTDFHFWTHCIHPDDREQAVGFCQAETARGKDHSFDYRMVAADGRIVWLRDVVSVFCRNGNPTTLRGYFIDITERKQVESALRESETRFRSYFELPVIGVAVTSLEKGWLEVNSRLCEIMGYAKEELLKLTWTDITYPDDLARDVGEFEKVLAGQSDGYALEKRFIRKDGAVIHAFIAVRCVRKADGAIDYFVALVQDIEDRKRAEAELRIAATAFESNEAMMVTDAQGVILRVNKAFSAMTGYAAEEVLGKTPRILKSGRHDADFYRAMWKSLGTTGCWQGEIWDKHKDGRIFPLWMTVSVVRNDEGAITHYVGSQYDITERKRYEERINTLAFYDQLTGLPNRTLLLDRLTQSMSNNARTGSRGALMFIDLDNFKTLNDSQGHEVGDELLKQVALRLKQCLREEDSAARQGGDEFVVVLEGLRSDEHEAGQAAEIVAEKILAQLREPYLLGNLTHRCSASIGVTLFQGHQCPVDELMKQGDLAMYKSKAAGRNVVRFYDPALQSAIQARALMENDLRVAIEKQQFFLHYQPQVADTRIVGAEALVRWRHPQRGMVSPADFIALAEETDLILPLGDWVMRTACMQLAQWATQPNLAELTVAVNVSARQFLSGDFVQGVLAVLHDTGANPLRLKLELTESLLALDIEHIISTMHKLKAHGVGFSLDDFGTGYSSLSYLKRLPLDQLKIDQSFVRDVLTDANDAAIAKTVVALGQTLGLSVIAEGVETEAQRAFLASIGCFTYQGYLFSRPVPVEEFEQLLPEK